MYRQSLLAVLAAIALFAGIHAGQWWLFYAVVAGVTLWASWADHAVRPVGYALVFSYLASNAAHMWLAPVERPQAYTVCEAAVMSMAFFAHVMGASRAMVAVVAVSVVSVALNYYVSTFDIMTRAQTVTWEVATNLCYLLECLLVTSAMIYDQSGARDWLAGRRARSSFHGRAADKGKAQ